VITRISRRDEETRQALGGLGPQNTQVHWTHWRSKELKALLRGWETNYFNHFPARRLRGILPKQQWDDYYKFTIERNPWDMAVSAKLGSRWGVSSFTSFWRVTSDQITRRRSGFDNGKVRGQVCSLPLVMSQTNPFSSRGCKW